MTGQHGHYAGPLPVTLAGNLIADYAREGSRKIGTVRRARGNRLMPETLARLSRDETRHFSADTIRLYPLRYEDSLAEFIREMIAGCRIKAGELVSFVSACLMIQVAV